MYAACGSGGMEAEMKEEKLVRMDEEKGVMKIDFLNPSSLEFRLDNFMRVILHNKTTKETLEDVDIKLMFPLTNKTGYLEIYCGDDEVGVIRDLGELSQQNRKMVEDVLEKRYFVPEIKQVLKVTEKYRLVYWEVMTDRGEMNFYTKTRNDVVVKDSKVYIRDIDSNRYLIRDITELNPQSRKELNSEI